MEKKEVEPLPVRLKYYTTLTLGLVSCISCFVFLFMIPFFLEPCISTLVANFDPEPIVCRTVYVEHKIGSKNCSWSSCRQGCTFDQYDCDQIYVDYIKTPFVDFKENAIENTEDMWTVKGVPIFVNIKACGYPPTTNCTIFSLNYGGIGTVFPCHYSQADPSLVITDYSWHETVKSLILALIIPNLLTGVSLAILSYWWYPGCQRRKLDYQIPPDQNDENDENNDENNENIDENDEYDDENNENDDEEHDEECDEKYDTKNKDKNINTHDEKIHDNSIRVQID